MHNSFLCLTECSLGGSTIFSIEENPNEETYESENTDDSELTLADICTPPDRYTSPFSHRMTSHKT